MALVPDVLVDLVDDGDEAMALADARDLRRARRGGSTRPEGFPGVLRRSSRVRLPIARSSRAEIDRVVRLAHRDEARRDAGQHAGGQVVLVPGLEDEGLVARLGQAEDGADLRLRDAAGDGDLGCGIDSHRVESAMLLRQGLAKALFAPGVRVLVVAGVDRAAQRGEQLRRRIEVRQSLREVDAADLGAEPRHLADHGLLERPGAAGERDLPPPGGNSLAGGSRGGAHRRTRLSPSRPPR